MSGNNFYFHLQTAYKKLLNYTNKKKKTAKATTKKYMMSFKC